jgi:hypothetical protein
LQRIVLFEDKTNQTNPSSPITRHEVY